MTIENIAFADLNERNFNPLNDVIFKFIFGREERKSILLDFLNTVLTDSLGHEIKDIIYAPTELTASNIGDKSTRLDIACVLDSGEQVDVEVQVVNQMNMSRRTLYYWSQMYLASLSKGENYLGLKPAITINLLAFNLFEGENPHIMFGIYNLETLQRLNNDLELHFLELPKFSAGKRKLIRDMTRMERWLAYFENKLTDKERSELSMENVAIADAMAAAREFLASTAERRAYINRQMAIMDYKSAMEGSHKEGLSQGIAIGESRGKLSGKLLAAQNLAKSQNWSLKKAMEAIGLTAEEQEQLQALQ